MTRRLACALLHELPDTLAGTGRPGGRRLAHIIRDTAVRAATGALVARLTTLEGTA